MNIELVSYWKLRKSNSGNTKDYICRIVKT